MALTTNLIAPRPVLSRRNERPIPGGRPVCSHGQRLPRGNASGRSACKLRISLGVTLDHIAKDVVPTAVASGLIEFLTIDDEPLVSLKLLRIFENFEKPFELLIVLEEVSRK